MWQATDSEIAQESLVTEHRAGPLLWLSASAGHHSQPVDILEHSLDAAHKLRGPCAVLTMNLTMTLPLEALRDHIGIPVPPACSGNVPPPLPVITTAAQLHVLWVGK